jgi:hypothetical protein
MGYRRRIGLLLGLPLLSVLLALIIYRVSRPPTTLDTLALFLGSISGLLGCWYFRNTLGRVNLPPLSLKTTLWQEIIHENSNCRVQLWRCSCI